MRADRGGYEDCGRVHEDFGVRADIDSSGSAHVPTLAGLTDTIPAPTEPTFSVGISGADKSWKQMIT